MLTLKDLTAEELYNYIKKQENIDIHPEQIEDFLNKSNSTYTYTKKDKYNYAIYKGDVLVGSLRKKEISMEAINEIIQLLNTIQGVENRWMPEI